MRAGSAAEETVFSLPHLHPLVAILGPTGAGKSDLAIQLARTLRGEVLSCDSVQVYRGLDIGSAKTPAAARCGVRHHLLDIIDADAELTAGEYARRARQVLKDIRSREALPVLAGGTGLYLRALVDGLSPAPERDAALRARLNALAARRPAVLQRFLRRHDAVSAARIHANDRQKLIRAIELTLTAGRSASETQSLPRRPLAGYRVLKLALQPDRASLHERLNRRTAAMFENGLLEETRGLLEAGLAPDAKSLQTLGYKQALQVLAGAVPLAQAITECQSKTRQYAKRQMTWFRAEGGVEWLAGFGGDACVQEAALARVREFLRA
jgi:tRNA dimethylallyltransferase